MPSTPAQRVRTSTAQVDIDLFQLSIFLVLPQLLAVVLSCTISTGIKTNGDYGLANRLSVV